MKSEETIFRGEKYSVQEKKSGYKTVMLLTVHNITKGDYGTYTCIAQNTMGKSEDSVRLYEIRLTTTKISSPTKSTPPPFYGHVDKSFKKYGIVLHQIFVKTWLTLCPKDFQP
ncbi:unnamed protein product [Acanthoscelides obtectus]|uniref:Immunoglobulin I-set domain-containing protein n=1 Tax=Acanthoscelides obtectus TaxID=200917 RepID=A0A9P0LKP3_ACAOB|nr:unnamed protein product [Acanthoscelides obtectus]CAK1660286.1 hypothetical protein AOBTE_LOCUS21966 [Acanthoscelides obtectus]